MVRFDAKKSFSSELVFKSMQHTFLQFTGEYVCVWEPNTQQYILNNMHVEVE